MQEMVITTLNDLEELAKQVLEAVRKKGAAGTATVLALHGELGAGKTAFTQTLAKLLGVVNPVTSPTFVIMRLYPVAAHEFFRKLVHIDAYRIESLNEMNVIGFESSLCDPANLICVEWAGKIEKALPNDALHITFTQSEISEDSALRTAVYGYKNDNENSNEN
jgi:tRNA threonylcarbamoyladenosine biosynthesis protein TsaE